MHLKVIWFHSKPVIKIFGKGSSFRVPTLENRAHSIMLHAVKLRAFVCIDGVLWEVKVPMMCPAHMYENMNESIFRKKDLRLLLECPF